MNTLNTLSDLGQDPFSGLSTLLFTIAAVACLVPGGIGYSVGGGKGFVVGILILPLLFAGGIGLSDWKSARRRS